MDNEKKLNILGIIIKIVIIAPALIFGLLVMSSGVNADSSEEVIQKFMNGLALNGAMEISYYAIIAAIILIIIFFVVLLVTRPMQALKSISGIIIAGIVFFILYATGTNDTVESLGVTGDITASSATMDFVHAGIFTALIGMGISAVLAVFLGVFVKLFRN
jgi:hypothetical protein